MHYNLTPSLVLEAYRHGLFPMAFNDKSPGIQWVCPEMRGQLPIKNLHIPRRLGKTVRQTLKKNLFQIRVNTDFERVLRACAETSETRPETWINESIIKTYCALHKQGHAHSVECWDDNQLVGGLYGLSIGGAFFGESMFSKQKDASKITLIHLAARLSKAKFEILDTQFVNPHLEQFGVYEIPHEDYMDLLIPVLEKPRQFQVSSMDEAQIVLDYLKKKAEDRNVK